ncbi:hypothetical protein EB796_019060 [Bugula neritina]|uniref:Uncharacterized protein n=1 Tax=Bugula neritina TaxID=10212 RepID=A0A7J7J9C6_BUGNE|nr:hypothetical protein EB796_019060 [Bugula neritina]
MMIGAGSLEINLYNFEDDEFAESPYVLTSPRSLQACDMLGVKPAHLLYKPLADFQDELLSTGLPLRAIYDEYDEHEKLRQRQLRECRDYRDKMIGDRVQHMMSSSAQKFIPCHTLSYEDAGYKSDESHYSSKKLHAASDGEIPSERGQSTASTHCQSYPRRYKVIL